MTATSSNSTKVTSDYWVEFVRIYDSNGDGVLQLDEFINFCRFQVAAVFFSNGVKAKGKFYTRSSRGLQGVYHYDYYYFRLLLAFLQPVQF